MNSDIKELLSKGYIPPPKNEDLLVGPSNPIFNNNARFNQIINPQIYTNPVINNPTNTNTKIINIDNI
jgi:hypothetical protein